MAIRPGTAVRWARLALAGSGLLALSAFVCLLRIPVLPVHGDGFWACVWAYRLRFVSYFLPFAVALWLMVWAERRFKRGFQQGLWTEAELRQVRALLEHKAWALLGGAAILLVVIDLFVQHSLRGFGFMYLFVMPAQVAQRIRTLIGPRVERSSGLAEWRSMGPLRSEHWGERNA